MAHIYLEKDIKLKYIEKLAYIVRHKIFGICANRKCDFTIKYFNVT